MPGRGDDRVLYRCRTDPGAGGRRGPGADHLHGGHRGPPVPMGRRRSGPGLLRRSGRQQRRLTGNPAVPFDFTAPGGKPLARPAGKARAGRRPPAAGGSALGSGGRPAHGHFHRGEPNRSPASGPVSPVCRASGRLRNRVRHGLSHPHVSSGYFILLSGASGTGALSMRRRGGGKSGLPISPAAACGSPCYTAWLPEGFCSPRPSLWGCCYSTIPWWDGS